MADVRRCDPWPSTREYKCRGTRSLVVQVADLLLEFKINEQILLFVK